MYLEHKKCFVQYVIFEVDKKFCEIVATTDFETRDAYPTDFLAVRFTTLVVMSVNMNNEDS